MTEGLLERLVSNLPGMAYRCRHDADWTLEFVSDGCLELLGYTPRELGVERTVAISDLIHADDLARVSLELERALTARTPFSLRYRMRTADGGEKWIFETGRGIFGAGGALVALEGFLTDVSSQVHAEQSLQESQRRDAIGHLASGVAHDFNNLLLIIQMATQVLLDAIPVGDSLRDDATTIEQASMRAEVLTRQLLSFGRSERFYSVPSDLSELIAKQVEFLRRVLGPKARLRFRSSDEPLVVQCDIGRFEHVLVNLIANARDAMEGTGSVEITIDRAADGKCVCLEVHDDGPGMSATVRERVFEPFFTTRQNRGGTGLGLAVVHDFVRESRGEIEVVSEPGEGTTFRIRLPLASELVTDVRDEKFGTEVVLLAEDDGAVRRGLAQGLRRFGYTVLEAANGVEAVKISERHKGPIDALVADAKMPEMGGIGLAGVFRDQRPDVPIILISGDNVLPPDGLVESFLSKPLGPEDIATGLRRVLQQREHQ